MEKKKKGNTKSEKSRIGKVEGNFISVWLCSWKTKKRNITRKRSKVAKEREKIWGERNEKNV